jgi:hypothetical protein
MLISVYLPVHADATFVETWESYEVGERNMFIRGAEDFWRPNTHPSSYYEIVGHPTRSGKKSIKFFNYFKSTNDGFRNELSAWAGRKSGHARTYTIGEEGWIGFSIYLPTDYVCDGCVSNVYANEIHMQIFPYPDRVKRQREGYPEEEWLQPCIVFAIKKDKWIIATKSDSKPVTEFGKYERTIRYDAGSWLADRGKWTDWVFHFKLDYTKNGDNGGFLKVYKDGILILHDIGGNCLNDILGPYPVIGTYKYGWRKNPTDTNTRTVYFDEIRIGDRNSSYNDVAPRRNLSINPPKSLKVVKVK